MLGLLAGLILTARRPQVGTIDHTGPTIEQVRGWASLVATKVTTADVITAEVEGVGGSITAVLIVKGECRSWSI